MATFISLCVYSSNSIFWWRFHGMPKFDSLYSNERFIYCMCHQVLIYVHLNSQRITSNIGQFNWKHLPWRLNFHSLAWFAPSSRSNAIHCKVQWSLQQAARESSVNWIIFGNFIVRFMWHGTNKHWIRFEMRFFWVQWSFVDVVVIYLFFSYFRRHRSKYDLSKVQPFGQSEVMMPMMMVVVVIATTIKWTMPMMMTSQRCKFNGFRFTDCDWS